MKPDVLVLGAGMVGTCTALHLALRGHAVTLVDRREPGRETSYGNAGIIQREAVVPYAFPRHWGKLLGVALGRGADVHYHLGALPGLAGPLARYWRNSAPARHAQLSQAYAALIAHSLHTHDELIELAGAHRLVRREGYRWIFRTPAAMDAAVAEAQQLAARHGLRHAVMDRATLRREEPGVTERAVGALHWLDPWTVNDPGALVGLYAQALQARGGRVLIGDATSLAPAGRGWRVHTAEGEVQAAQAVVALGPWSAGLLQGLGYRYPLFIKRGYHRHYAAPVLPRLSLYDVEAGLVMGPMQRGVRVTTGAEFARLDAAPTPVQMHKAEVLAHELLPLGTPVEETPWMGARPCTADMLPVIGAAPRHRGLWFNLGHAHQGFTLGPASGRLLAELIGGEAPLLDPAPYAPARFG
ncbi:MAG: FAD-binding oxidoreductase [Aquincola sp.]|nr:FAD-binding oxidoreductase [Aquincola sp.]